MSTASKNVRTEHDFDDEITDPEFDGRLSDLDLQLFQAATTSVGPRPTSEVPPIHTGSLRTVGSGQHGSANAGRVDYRPPSDNVPAIIPPQKRRG